MNGLQLPHILTDIPGPCSQAQVDILAQHECPAITARRARRAEALGQSDTDPIVWKAALGANVMDVDNNLFVDLTAGFGVAGAGHRHPMVVEAAASQSSQLIHAMGDAFPDPKRIELLQRLSLLTGYPRSILGCSGSDAIDAAVKTAVMATGRHQIIAFEAGYHGLAFGSLPATHYKAGAFRGPFQKLLGQHVCHLPYGQSVDAQILSQSAAVLVEPIQGRGGIRVPPDGWLAGLIRDAHDNGCMVIFDEIYTGFGRTGTPFAFQDDSLEGERPDLVCVGKALGGGFPISACLGTAEAMDAWGGSKGEAIHTQTFLGNPLGCAMAIASLNALETVWKELKPTIAHTHSELQRHGIKYQGRGMLLGLQVPDPLGLCRQLLKSGYIALPAGINAEVLAFTPPLCITKNQITASIQCIADLCNPT